MDPRSLLTSPSQQPGFLQNAFSGIRHLVDRAKAVGSTVATNVGNDVKAVGDFLNQTKPPVQTFGVGEGLNAGQQETASHTIGSNVERQKQEDVARGKINPTANAVDASSTEESALGTDTLLSQLLNQSKKDYQGKVQKDVLADTTGRMMNTAMGSVGEMEAVGEGLTTKLLKSIESHPSVLKQLAEGKSATLSRSVIEDLAKAPELKQVDRDLAKKVLDSFVDETKNNFHNTFQELKSVPKGTFIERPTEIVKAPYTISEESSKVIGAKNTDVSFTRRTMKHIAEKGKEGERLFNMVPDILGTPDDIRLGGDNNRFLFSKSVKDIKGGRPHVVTLEVTEKDGNLVVTSFQSDDKYLSDYEPLWKTGVPEGTVLPSAYSSETNAGSRPDFSALKEVPNRITRGAVASSSLAQNALPPAGPRPLEGLSGVSNPIDLLPQTAKQVNIPIEEFSTKMRDQLLPLKVEGLNSKGMTTVPYRYESINLPSELRGKIENYSENVYQSPIKTSAGDVHFNSDKFPNYFAHTRIEDVPGGTRRVIEVQSDLFQKGRLDAENGGKMHIPLSDVERAKISQEGGTITERNSKTSAIQDARAKEFSKLEPYRNIWHERVIREEVKQAAKDGKKVLQFPTGETAMKIEGLGETGIGSEWFAPYEKEGVGAYMTKINPEKLDTLRPGQLINRGDRASGDWVITDVLGDGKFKAVPKSIIDTKREAINYSKDLSDEDFLLYADHHVPEIGDYTESFDISGNVDKENPIYRFYDKTVSKYLKNKYNAELVSDKQGVSWMQINVDPKEAGKSVEAFGILPPVGKKKEKK